MKGDLADELLQNCLPEAREIIGRDHESVKAVRPQSLSGLSEAVQRALSAEGPTLIEVREDSSYL